MSGNYAYIDSINIYLGVQKLGWVIDYGKLRRYLKDKYDVTKAYYFIGYVPKSWIDSSPVGCMLTGPLRATVRSFFNAGGDNYGESS